MDELRSFEQTHWLREYVAHLIAVQARRNHLVFSDWAELGRDDKEYFRKLADKCVADFKLKIEAAQQ